MTQLMLGRVFDGHDVAPSTFQVSGRTLSMSGPITTDTYDELRAVRERFEALVDNVDERAVPVTFTEDGTIDGWYEPRSAQWAQDSASPVINSAFWAVELERVGDQSESQQLELRSVHSVRENQNGIDTSDYSGTSGWLDWIPGAATDWYNGSLATAVSRSADDGFSGSALGIPLSAAGQTNTAFSITPSRGYSAACSIRCLYGSAADLVGGRAGGGAFGAGEWVVSNGIVRVSQHPSDNSALRVEVRDSGSWVTMHSGVGWYFGVDYGGGSSAGWNINTANVVVLRNSPEMAAIRLQILNSSFSALFGRVWLDLAVRRGDRHVTGVFRVDSRGSLGGVLTMRPSSSIAATALFTSAGLRATSNDSNGNRAVWGCAGAVAVTQNTTTGKIEQSSGGGTTGNELPFCIGVELDGSSASGAETASNVLLQWYDGRQDEQMVVRR